MDISMKELLDMVQTRGTIIVNSGINYIGDSIANNQLHKIDGKNKNKHATGKNNFMLFLH
jgi:hypothetical protein